MKVTQLHMNSVENIINGSDNLDELSRDIVTYFGANSQFDEKLADDNSLECQLFNLAVQYLDKKRGVEREETGRKLRALAIDYKNV